jgi:HAD superfamily hydrolase (TIGR01450 family)
MCDVLRSPNGAMGAVGNDTHPQPFLAFSHGDLLWGNEFATARFGQGAFQTAFRAVYEETSGRKLEATTFGKPQRLTYEYADERIKERVKAVEGKVDDLSVWMVGDNPASDIAGANAFGWKSALVSQGMG